MADHEDTNAAVEPALPTQQSALHRNVTEILPCIPVKTQFVPLQLCNYNGFWLPEKLLANIPIIHSCLDPRPDDIFLTSYPKSGTTWLKGLAFATLNRGTHSPLDGQHPLRHCNPHDCVSFIDMDSMFKKNAEINNILDEFEALPSPRLVGTHLPYSILPESITCTQTLGSRIVYICRNPKDVLVSEWFFTKKLPPMCDTDMQPYTLQEAFKLFCEGRSLLFGPQWKHALQYWEASLLRPEKVLFLMYEDMLREPVSNLKKLAEFMGCAFSEEEEKGGVVNAIVDLSKMKSMEVNKNGTNSLAVKNDAYFRKGMPGDWRNHLTLEMAEELDKIVEEVLRGSGLTFIDSL